MHILPFVYSSFLLTCIGRASGATYRLSDNIVGRAFLSEFHHQAISDPTHGRVNYVEQSTALAQNLTFATDDTFVIRGDHRATLGNGGPGRNSVRIMSNKQWTTHVAVFDIVHMPRGCGTWPALWEVGNNWPYGGEIDIVEGVNDLVPNQVTVHTRPGCTMSNQHHTGTTVSTDCNAFANSNTGCGVKVNHPFSYGPAFDAFGGGWYAIERTSSHINVYFWSRTDWTVPSDVKNGASTVDTSNWGQPVANFPSSNTCDINSVFGPNNIVINLTFCGDWAGNVYATSGCPSTCVDFVNNNPSAFVNAYWQFNSLRVYT